MSLTPPSSRRERVALALVAIAVFCSRLPFINNGFGRDPDAWRLIKSGRLLATTGTYEPSRFPGYPIPEFAYAALSPAPRLWLLVVVLLSTLATLLFAGILKRVGCRDVVWGALAFAATPVIYINSTNTMDYMWALTFILGALYFVMTPRPITAGVFAGMAIACRATSVIMLLPLSVILLGKLRPDRQSVWNTMRMLTIAVATTAVAYAPIVIKYGTEMFTFVDDGREIKDVLSLAGPGVWGPIGVFGVLAAVSLAAILLIASKRTRGRVAALGMRHVVAWIAAIILSFVMFLRLPGEAGYLVLVVPMLLLILAPVIPRWVFAALCVVLAVSSFVDIRKAGVFPGPVLQNNYVRGVFFDDSHVILRSVDKLDEGDTIILSGWLTSQLVTLRLLTNLPDRAKSVTFARELDRAHTNSGNHVYIVPVAGLFPPGALKEWQGAGVRPLPIR